jgi:hypothetical protein
MRGLAASSAALLQGYAAAVATGEGAVARVIAEAFPPERGPSEDATSRLAHYLTRVMHALEAQDLAALSAGRVRFPEPASGAELGDNSS